MKRIFLLFVFILLLAQTGLCEEILVYSTDDAYTNISKMEGAQAGDTVLIHPGTYKFAVVLTNSGTAENPITIKGTDPNNRPVFDLSDYENIDEDFDRTYEASDFGLGSWPGGDWGAGEGIAPHSSSGHWTRGAITLWGCGYVNIEDIEITGFHKYQGDGNGIRAMIDGGPININRVKITNCDNGLDVLADVGGGDDTLTASHCEFAYNGRYPNRALSPGGHNVYTHGAALVLEYCYIHDAREGQNLHLRNTYADIRYCWLESPYTYHFDQCSINTGDLPEQQIHTYMGNVFVDGQGDFVGSANHVFVVMEGSLMQGQQVPQRLNLYYNTFIGTGDNRWLVSFSGEGSTLAYLPSLYMYNNIIWGNTNTLRMQYPGEYGTIDIQKNWFPTADYSQWENDDRINMENNIFGSDPGFVNRVGGNYTLADDSPVIDQANPSLGEFPGYAYLHEMEHRIREEANDLGAYEFGESGDGGNNGARAGGCSMRIAGRDSRLSSLAVLLLVGMLICRKKMRKR